MVLEILKLRIAKFNELEFFQGQIPRLNIGLTKLTSKSTNVESGTAITTLVNKQHQSQQMLNQAQQ